MSRTILIGSHEAAQGWCFDNKRNPRDRSLFIINSPDSLVHLRGHEFVPGEDRVELLYDAHKVHDFDAVLMEIQTRFRKRRENLETEQ